MSMTVGITELPPEGMQLGGVALAGDAERGTKTTEGLSLLFTTAGITVQGPQPQIERLLVWSGLDSASCHEKVVLPDGRNAAVMELTSGGQSIRFLFPTETVTPGQAAYLDQALPHWLARYKGAQPAPVATNGSGSGPAAPPAAPGAAPGEGAGRGRRGRRSRGGRSGRRVVRRPGPSSPSRTGSASPTAPSGNGLRRSSRRPHCAGRVSTATPAPTARDGRRSRVDDLPRSTCRQRGVDQRTGGPARGRGGRSTGQEAEPVAQGCRPRGRHDGLICRCLSWGAAALRAADGARPPGPHHVAATTTGRPRQPHGRRTGDLEAAP